MDQAWFLQVDASDSQAESSTERQVDLVVFTSSARNAERAVKDAAPPVPGEPEEDEYDRYSRGYALVVRGMARAEVGDPGAGIRDLEAAIELAPDEETAREWQAALDELRDRAQ